MRPNPLLSALGYCASDRVVIFHADDIGMCGATVDAYADLLEAGLLTSAALMVPCPAAAEGAAVARAHPAADMGVHLTITSEWDALRWGPVSTRDPASGLLDAQGYFPHDNPEIQANGRPEAVRDELAAQVSRARAWGVDVTHVDSHMGALAHPKFLPAVMALAGRERVPAMYPRMGVDGWRAQGFDPLSASLAWGYGRLVQAAGRPLVDHLRMLPLHVGGDHVELTRRMLADLPPGITHFILHPARDTPELRAICSDWEGRVANYEAFRDPRMVDVIAQSGVHAIGYRPLREWMRQPT
ncbi:ChbG/HpnK family deacetylase [Deinococcus sp. KSM4-11]|uniref:polysaccharide deacetylase family protein n=1 Tax=Deinococcus sp. KSM4-11 TaxID=2568654 RepID=UPI0010A2ADC2|nr:polysaccharide deacetylase family protein [Deinococcus sp. KSM4-11]THF84957.1 ChbG/HpnK family deacetylase [Deinococcus sp. KSM4-11]